MESIQSDAQQLIVLKHAIKKYQRPILATLATIVVVIGGTSYWQYHTKVKLARASDIYQEMLVAYNKQDERSLTEKANLLFKDKSTPYAQAAAVLLAKNEVQAGNLDNAEQLLKSVLEQRKPSNVVYHIAKIRLANIMRERGNIDGALALLDAKAIEEKGASPYAALYQETIGDLYLAKGDKQLARAAYNKALSELPEGAQAPVLQMKLNDLGMGETNAS